MNGRAAHLDLDGAWPESTAGLSTIDARVWGPRLRFCTTVRRVENFYEELQSQLTPFLLYGSGDFHHLSALWLRAIAQPFTLFSFDNHPDWDRRPPLWQCGSWINRAMSLPNLVGAQIWGADSPDVGGIGRLFANPRALRSGKLHAHSSGTDWLEKFAVEASRMEGEPVYVTIDLDCLRADEAVTSWDQGQLKADEIVLALELLRQHATIVGGDVCGAWSEPVYERPFQRIAAGIDHPKIDLLPPSEIFRKNQRVLSILWPALTA